jgi:hypothetical protein
MEKHLVLAVWLGCVCQRKKKVANVKDKKKVVYVKEKKKVVSKNLLKHELMHVKSSVICSFLA